MLFIYAISTDRQKLILADLHFPDQHLTRASLPHAQLPLTAGGGRRGGRRQAYSVGSIRSARHRITLLYASCMYTVVPHGLHAWHMHHNGLSLLLNGTTTNV